MAYYKDLHEYLDTLERRGKLVRIKRPINKDTQLHPLVRLQYRGLPEEQRKAFLFENVTDSRGKKYNIPVLIGALSGNSEIYSIGMMCQPEEMVEKFIQAQLHPIKPRMVKSAPVYEEVHVGDGLIEHGGLDEFPIPIATPGYDVAPFITAPLWITKDPKSGIRNVGTYRAQLKAPLRTGICFDNLYQGGAIHWLKCQEMGIPLQAAIVIGGPPNLSYVSVAKIPVDFDELEVAGGIAGGPVELVKCKTIDLEVPARAEIVIEGEISTTRVEPEAPFGEAKGFIGLAEMFPCFTVKCVAHRKNPIWLAILSQYMPSECNRLRSMPNEAVVYKHLKYDLGMNHVLAAACHEVGSGGRYFVIQMKRTDPSQVWRTLEEAGNFFPAIKIIIAVDEDVNLWDLEAVNMAMVQRMLPHRDIRIVKSKTTNLADLSLAPIAPRKRGRKFGVDKAVETSRLLCNATIKWDYPPLSLPRKEFMEEALHIWQKEGLPELNLKAPWWGYSLGCWSQEDDENARLATQGKYYQTGEKYAKKRKRV